MTTNQYCATFPNVGFVGATVTDRELAPIMAAVNKIEEDFTGLTTPGFDLKIEHGYYIDDQAVHSNILEILSPLIHTYKHQFNYNTKEGPNYKMNGVWVNFQSKHEFARPHSHHGSFSFALWLKVPYDFKDETANSTIAAASFNFHYTDALGRIQNWVIPVDKTYEKRIIVFPSDMSHSVYPFYTSDEYRIVVAGNVIPDV